MGDGPCNHTTTTGMNFKSISLFLILTGFLLLILSSGDTYVKPFEPEPKFKVGDCFTGAYIESWQTVEDVMVKKVIQIGVKSYRVNAHWGNSTVTNINSDIDLDSVRYKVECPKELK